jgi:hypothetical protein
MQTYFPSLIAIKKITLPLQLVCGNVICLYTKRFIAAAFLQKLSTTLLLFLHLILYQEPYCCYGGHYNHDIAKIFLINLLKNDKTQYCADGNDRYHNDGGGQRA